MTEYIGDQKDKARDSKMAASDVLGEDGKKISLSAQKNYSSIPRPTSSHIMLASDTDFISFNLLRKILEVRIMNSNSPRHVGMVAMVCE